MAETIGSLSEIEVFADRLKTESQQLRVDNFFIPSDVYGIKSPDVLLLTVGDTGNEISVIEHVLVDEPNEAFNVAQALVTVMSRAVGATPVDLNRVEGESNFDNYAAAVEYNEPYVIPVGEGWKLIIRGTWNPSELTAARTMSASIAPVMTEEDAEIITEERERRINALVDAMILRVQKTYESGQLLPLGIERTVCVHAESVTPEEIIDRMKRRGYIHYSENYMNDDYFFVYPHNSENNDKTRVGGVFIGSEYVEKTQTDEPVLYEVYKDEDSVTIVRRGHTDTIQRYYEFGGELFVPTARLMHEQLNRFHLPVEHVIHVGPLDLCPLHLFGNDFYLLTEIYMANKKDGKDTPLVEVHRGLVSDIYNFVMRTYGSEVNKALQHKPLNSQTDDKGNTWQTYEYFDKFLQRKTVVSTKNGQIVNCRLQPLRSER